MSEGKIQAAILAGGMGARLRLLTIGIPKPMAPVAGKPFLERQIEMLREQGVGDIVLLTGRLGEVIERHFSDGSRFGVRIRYSREPAPLGTGGALARAADLLADAFLLLNGDSYLPIDYPALLDRLLASDALAALAVYDNRGEDSGVANNIAVDPDGYVTRYEKDAPDGAGLTHVDAGALAMRKSALELCPSSGAFSLETELYNRLGAGRELLAYPTGQRFYDIGTPERLRFFERVILR